MSPAAKRAVLIGGVVAMIAIVVAGVVTLTGGGSGSASQAAAVAAATTTTGVPAPDPTSAAQQYLQAFGAVNVAEASALTDDPGTSAEALRAAWTSLSPSEIETNLASVGPAAGNQASVTYTATWLLEGGHTWRYQATFDVTRIGGNWRVHWTPAVLYPTLQAGQRLALVTSAPDQPAVVDVNGKPLVLTGTSGLTLADPDFAGLKSTLVGQAPGARSVFAVERVDGAGHDLQLLTGSTGQIKPIVTTLSATVQSAAQAVVNSYPGPAVIVALQPSTGGVLAVAQNSRSTDLPFSGQYPPGSTFKIVTATASMEAGIATPDTELPCPATEQIGTRTLTNDDDFALGTVPMTVAFAKSCNTTFGQLASRLSTDELADVARQYGLSADFAIPGLSTQTGDIAPPGDADQQVEDGIGQGNTQVSPFGEAVMAATVAAGHPVVPQLWPADPTSVVTGYTGPPASVLASLRTMMRAVVTEGTATGLAGSGLVYGKTGTAQFGDASTSHGWFVGYRGDLAFVVFLNGAGSSAPAVTVAAKFLAALG